jgi:transposase InsO family protein
LKSEHPIARLCEAFGVSKSGYYQWQQRREHPAQRRQEDEQLKREISRIHQESRRTYGAPRIHAVLRGLDRKHGRNRIGRLMRELQICGRQKRRYRVQTTESKHDQPIAPNRLKERPRPSGPNQIWVADITYIKTGQSWLYLAAILDLYSRKIVGWAAGRQIDTGLVLQAQAIASMSRKANCYDNAAMEAFWSTLKLELVYRQEGEFASPEEARPALFDYIEVFYNRQRLHSALGYRSPADFEAAMN